MDWLLGSDRTEGNQLPGRLPMGSSCRKIVVGTGYQTASDEVSCSEV